MNDNSINLLGGACPKCKSVDAWHGVITEPDEGERFACDECGMWMAVKVTQPKPPRAKRSFKFSIDIDNGALFVDIADRAILAFKPGRYLALGDNWELLSSAEAEEREERFTKVGKMIGREEAEGKADARVQQALEACEERFTKWPGTGFPPASATVDEEQAS